MPGSQWATQAAAHPGILNEEIHDASLRPHAIALTLIPLRCAGAVHGAGPNRAAAVQGNGAEPARVCRQRELRFALPRLHMPGNDRQVSKRRSCTGRRSTDATTLSISSCLPKHPKRDAAGAILLCVLDFSRSHEQWPLVKKEHLRERLMTLWQRSLTEGGKP